MSQLYADVQFTCYFGIQWGIDGVIHDYVFTVIQIQSKWSNMFYFTISSRENAVICMSLYFFDGLRYRPAVTLNKSSDAHISTVYRSTRSFSAIDVSRYSILFDQI